MAGRCAAILLIRLVAPCARSAALSLLAQRPLRVFGWSTLSIDALLFCFFVYVIPNHTFPVSAARSRARLLFPSPRRLMRRSFSFSCGVSRAPRVFSFPAPSPRGVGGAPRGALRNRSRLRSATTVLARHGPSRATGRRLSALHRGGLRTARPRVTYPIVPRTMPRLPAAGRKASRSGPAASRPRLHRGFGTPHPAPPQNVSGDAPHERGWGGYSTDALCRQDRIHM
jgi:hypothetical protein